MGAEVKGTLVVDLARGCVQLRRLREDLPVVWPSGTTAVPEGVRLNDGQVVPAGATITGAGGFMTVAQAENLVGTPFPGAADCAEPSDDVAVFNEHAPISVSS